MTSASRSSMPVARCACALAIGADGRAFPLPRRGRHRHAAAHLSADGAHAQSRAMRARTTTPRPNSTPRADRSRSFPCPAGVQVWSACSIRRRAPDLAAMTGAALAEEIERRAHSLLGRMSVEARPRPFSARCRDRGCFAARRASRWSARRRTCVPPIGAQGLNLGLRDGATLAEIVADARRGQFRRRRARGARTL